MKSIAVMQPYFFPYIGYFQLLHSVDLFIFYDDVDFIKNGWINRNRILINGKSKYFTIPCSNVSSFKKIKDVKHALNDRKRKKLLKKIKFSYSNAPYFDSVYNIIKTVVNYDTDNISELAIQSLQATSTYLGLDTTFKRSSRNYDNQELSAVDRLIDISKSEDSKHYINSIGGKELYDKGCFDKRGVKLSFLNPINVEYDQFGVKFIPWLSIIDVMMFNSPEVIKKEFLPSYQLV